jgi:L-fuculose-phosphate aldolase
MRSAERNTTQLSGAATTFAEVPSVSAAPMNLDLARQVCSGMRQLEASGLNRGTAGNLSVRDSDGFLMSPSGIKPHDLEPKFIVALSADGAHRESGKQPSSEWRFHRDIYRARPDDAQAIVQGHSAYATALACQRMDMPSFHYMVAVAGGPDIRCAPYAIFGSQALADAAVAALEQRRACLLANHGLIAVGATVMAAIDLALEVEELARQYILTRALGEPALLSENEMFDVIEKFKTYGAPDGGQ